MGSLIGKVAADHSHKWIYKEPNEQEINFLSTWHNSADSHPRTWEAQFQAGIKTIALIAVREGVVQLGAVHKVIEDPSYVVLLRKKFSYVESIPGVLLPHPSSSAYPVSVDGYSAAPEGWPYPPGTAIAPPPEFYEHHFNHQHHQQAMKITPSMSSLEALLSKLPSVVPPKQVSGAGNNCESQSQIFLSPQRAAPSVEYMGLMAEQKVAKEEMDEEYSRGEQDNMGESSSSISAYRRQQQHQHQHHYHHHQDLNVTSASGPSTGF